jgi:hypothetical protein
MSLESLILELGPVKRRPMTHRIALTPEISTMIGNSSGELYDILEELARSDTELMAVVRRHSRNLATVDEFQAFLAAVAREQHSESQAGATSHQSPTGGLRFRQRR